MLAARPLMLLCLHGRRTTGSGDYILRSSVALLRTSHRFWYWPQCVYSGDSILLTQGEHEAVAAGWFCFWSPAVVTTSCCQRLGSALLACCLVAHRHAPYSQCRCPSCCVILALCRHSPAKPWLTSVGSHDAATCLPPEVHHDAFHN